MVWLHGSPAWIPSGDWVLPAAQLGGRSRSHPNGYGPEELVWYRPDRVYVFDSGGIEPRQHIGRFAYVRSDYYLYEVEPEELGPDDDAFAVTMQSASCARARVLRCVYEPDLLTLPADLSTVAGDGGRVIVPAAGLPVDRLPGVNQRIVLRDTGLAKAAVVRQLRDNGDLVVDVVGDRVRLLE